MSERIAILDLGTNTFNIFIAEILGDKTYQKLYKSKIPVKLGEAGINKNIISEKPFIRGIKALKKYKRRAEEFGVKKIFAFATSAIRSASNGHEFIHAAKSQTGIDVQVISGDKEAELIYYGVRIAVRMNSSPLLIMDIGGGSTEFIIANKNEIFWKQSFLLGAARILEKFRPSDPITNRETGQICHYFDENLSPLYNAVKKFPVEELVGASGSFDSLAEMIAYRYYDIGLLKGITEYEFNPDDCEKMYDIILKSTVEERKRMKGLSKMRVDMIVVSAIFMKFIFEKLRLKKMRLSRYSLKEGVLWELFNTPEFVNSLTNS